MDKKEKRDRIKAIGSRMKEIQDRLEETETWLEYINNGLLGQTERKNQNGYTYSIQIALGERSNGGSITQRRKLSGERLVIALTMFKLDEEQDIARLNSEYSDLCAELATLK